MCCTSIVLVRNSSNFNTIIDNPLKEFVPVQQDLEWYYFPRLTARNLNRKIPRRLGTITIKEIIPATSILFLHRNEPESSFRFQTSHGIIWAQDYSLRNRVDPSDHLDRSGNPLLPSLGAKTKTRKTERKEEGFGFGQGVELVGGVVGLLKRVASLILKSLSFFSFFSALCHSSIFLSTRTRKQTDYKIQRKAGRRCCDRVKYAR